MKPFLLVRASVPVLVAALALPCTAQDALVAARAAQRAHDCGSVVVVHCALPHGGAGAALDPERQVWHPAASWAAARLAADDDEIVVTASRQREPSPAQVFQRYLGPRRGAGDLLTHEAADGTRCTVVGGSGVMLCADSPGGLPQLRRGLSDWVF